MKSTTSRSTRSLRARLSGALLITFCSIGVAHASSATQAMAFELNQGQTDARVNLLAYSTYLGGSADEVPAGIAVDAAGNIYVAGTTASTDFPTGPRAGQRAALGGEDVFVTKFDSAGTRVYSTYLGTPCDDSAGGIAVDTSGSVYVTGRAWDGFCSADYPVPDYPGVFVAKLDPQGNQSYFFFFGPDTFDSSQGRAIAVDAAGQAYVTGVTDPSSSGFPTTRGAFRERPCIPEPLDYGDGFVAKLNAAGTALVYSTFLCGSGLDSPNAIAVDAAGNAYIAGSTESRDFPTVNAYQDFHRGEAYRTNAFVAKLNAAGSALDYSTYLGGSENTAALGLVLDQFGQAHVTGYTQATDFPTTAGVVQPTAGSRACLYGGCADAFVTKLSANGTSLRYSTYLFGDFDDYGVGIAVDSDGYAYVVGSTDSFTFPIVQAFHHRAPGNLGYDAFVTKLDPSGSSFVYSSYLGGSDVAGNLFEGTDEGLAIAVDGAGNAHVTGYTHSFDFPTTRNASQSALAEGFCGYLDYLCADVFVTRIAASGPGVTPAIRLRVSPASVPVGGTITATWAGIPSLSADDQLRLYRVGSEYNDYVAWWHATGAASGTKVLALPDWAESGWYELRLLGQDEYHSLVVVARSDAFRIGD